MRIRQAFASLAVLAVATGTLTACNDDAATSKADTPALQGSPSASDQAAAGSTSADAGGTGPKYAQVTVLWHEDESTAKKMAYELWPNAGVTGQLSQDDWPRLSAACANRA